MQLRVDSGPGRPRIQDFRTDDLDEATEFLFRNFGPNTRSAKDRGPLGFHLRASMTPRAASGSAAIGLRTTLRAATRWVTVHLPQQGGAEYRVGRKLLRSRPDVAVLLAPGHEYTRETCPGLDLAIQVEPGLLESVLGELEPRHVGSRAVRSIEIPISPGERTTFAGLVEEHAVVAADRRLASGEHIEAVEQRLARWVAGRIAAASGLAELSPSSREAAERVEAWIRAHLSQPISLEQLSGIAGLGGRTLQEACKARWGQSPLELVASRRLERVRTLLVTRPATTVTAAALQTGFTHLGRFSTQYRRGYGESPSDTLARARKT